MSYDKKKIKRVTINIEYVDNSQSQFIEFAGPTYKDINVEAKDEVQYEKGTRIDGVRRIQETMATGLQKMEIEIWAKHVTDEQKYDSWHRLIEKEEGLLAVDEFACASKTMPWSHAGGGGCGWGCAKGCGYTGITYASYEHYIAGDW